MKLDVKERKLLYWLDQNSRATNKELGKKIGLSEQAIGYKLKRFEEEGIIKKYVTFVNTLALGYSHYKVLLRLHNTNVEKEKEIVGYLIKNKNIRWVVTCSGKWDINFSIMARSPKEFMEIYREIETKIGNYIGEKNISILINSPGLTKGYLINQNNEKVLEYTPKNTVDKLDLIDKKILKSISQEARKNIVDIAQEINTSVDIVRYRIKKLEDNGFISGYTIQLGLDKLGILRYSIFFSLHKMTNYIEKEMFSFVKAHNNIIFMLTLVGTYDLSLELEVPSYDVLEHIIKKFRERFADNIIDFEMVLNTKEFKYDFYPF
jgi:Lrp/AsnC family transcriptional regulator, leucine-responsive regulatory protein